MMGSGRLVGCSGYSKDMESTTASDLCERKADWTLVRFSPDSWVVLPAGLVLLPVAPSEAPRSGSSLSSPFVVARPAVEADRPCRPCFWLYHLSYRAVHCGPGLRGDRDELCFRPQVRYVPAHRRRFQVRVAAQGCRLPRAAPSRKVRRQPLQFRGRCVRSAPQHWLPDKELRSLCKSAGTTFSLLKFLCRIPDLAKERRQDVDVP